MLEQNSLFSEPFIFFGPNGEFEEDFEDAQDIFSIEIELMSQEAKVGLFINWI